MSDAITVRPAQVDDLTKIVELRLALLREYADDPLYRQLRPDAPTRARKLFQNQLTSPDETMFLAERCGKVVGILRCVDSMGSPLLFPDRYCYVSSVYVLPSERRRGVLKALVDAAECWCRDRGLEEMRLHNAPSSQTASDTWDAFGFEIVEHVRRKSLRAESESIKVR